MLARDECLDDTLLKPALGRSMCFLEYFSNAALLFVFTVFLGIAGALLVM